MEFSAQRSRVFIQALAARHDLPAEFRERLKALCPKPRAWSDSVDAAWALVRKVLNSYGDIVWGPLEPQDRPRCPEELVKEYAEVSRHIAFKMVRGRILGEAGSGDYEDADAFLRKKWETLCDTFLTAEEAGARLHWTREDGDLGDYAAKAIATEAKSAVRAWKRRLRHSVVSDVDAVTRAADASRAREVAARPIDDGSWKTQVSDAQLVAAMTRAGLSAGQRDVCLQLFSGVKLEEVSRRLGIARETCRDRRDASRPLIAAHALRDDRCGLPADPRVDFTRSIYGPLGRLLERAFKSPPKELIDLEEELAPLLRRYAAGQPKAGAELYSRMMGNAALFQSPLVTQDLVSWIQGVPERATIGLPGTWPGKDRALRELARCLWLGGETRGDNVFEWLAAAKLVHAVFVDAIEEATGAKEAREKRRSSKRSSANKQGRKKRGPNPTRASERRGRRSGDG